jgi:HlyD family secretion protein
MSIQLFRKVSLERLSSPEQLDVLVKVTSPMGWLALLSVGVLLSVALVWGFYGSIRTTVNGSGILVRTGGIFEIDCVTGGQVSAIYVSVGDIVSRGQVVARVAQPKLVSDINRDRVRLDQMKDEYDKVARFNAEELERKLEYYAKQRVDLQNSIQLSIETLKWLNDRLENQEKLLQESLIRKQDYLNTKKEIFDTKGAIEKLRRDIKQVTLDEMEFTQKIKMEFVTHKHEIDKLKEQIESAEEDLELKSRIISPYSGSVVEVLADEGSFINGSDPIVTLELGGYSIKELETILYVPAGDGKRVKPGMQAQVSPSTIKREEWGCILGIVASVSIFPTTQKGMLRNLQNLKLVENFSSNGAPIEINVDLVPDPNTPSGYRWSTPNGPPVTVEHGTVCAATITVEEQSPISLVIPLFKKYVLGMGS